jgi:cell wall-associated NlpC family hydrolase
VKRFQAHHGLLVDGQVGDHTRARLHLALNRNVHHAPASSGAGRHQRASAGLGARAVALARRELGVPYVWGGESPAGFDCSGLVAYVYGRLGVSLPRVAADQYRAGRHIARSMLRPGDLVFFHGLGHVGIYIGGDLFIHAPHTGEVVRISSLTGWYDETYVGASRVV